MFVEIVSVGTKSGVQVYDLRRGTKLAQCLGVGVGGRQGFAIGDAWVAAVNEKKPVCHVYALNRGDTGAKLVFPFPEEVTCVHAVDGGRYLAAGARSGRIFVWAVASGRMVGSWDGHYGPVTALASCPGALVSGGEDAAVHVWLLSQALDQLATGDTAVAPIATVAEHTMPITALHISQAGLLAGRGRLYTASKDHTCKQWQVRVVRTGERLVGRAQLLATLLYPAAVSDIAVDQSETRAFAATAAGLFQTNLYAYGSASDAGRGLAALGGTSDSVVSECHAQYPSAEPRVAAVCLSLDGTLLVSASPEGVVRVWDTASRQCLRTISDKQLSSGVTQLSARLAPPQLGGPRVMASTGLRRPGATSGHAAAPKVASIGFAPLQRLAHESGAGETTAFEAPVKTTLRGAREDMAHFDTALGSDAPYGETAREDMRLLGGLRLADGSAKRQVAELHQQLERLQRHGARTRLLNDELYQGAITEWLGSRR